MSTNASSVVVMIRRRLRFSPACWVALGGDVGLLGTGSTADAGSGVRGEGTACSDGLDTRPGSELGLDVGDALEIPGDD